MKYKIIVRKITEYQEPEVEYNDLHEKDKSGNERWGYVKTGLMLNKETEKDIYEQVIEKEIDLKSVIDSFNK